MQKLSTSGIHGLLVVTLMLFAATILHARKPNVLMIVIDDLRTELGCYGAEGVHSPTMDKFAKRAMQFNRAYSQYPVCNPSRASFLSGLRPDEVGILSNTIPLRRVQPDLVTLPQLFRNNGYYTACVGKIFHLSIDDPDGKRRLFEDPLSWDFFYCALAERNFPEAGRKGEGRNVTSGEVGWAHWRAAEGGDISQPDGLNNAEVIRILEEHHEKPFFIGYGIHKPHDPFIAPKEYFALYPEDSIRLADEPADRAVRNEFSTPSNGRIFKNMTDQDRLEFKRAYRAGVSFADEQVRKLFAVMTRLKLWNNTIVIIMGDHGYHLGEHDWWNKVTIYEWGARAPMIIWVPGAKGMGQPTDAIMEFIDLYPTLADYAGLKSPHQLSGISLRPIFETPSLPGKEAAFTQVTRGKLMGYSVRTQRWRYVEWGPNAERGSELYDHQKDPGEYYNLSSNPEYASVTSKLSILMDDGFASREK